MKRKIEPGRRIFIKKMAFSYGALMLRPEAFFRRKPPGPAFNSNWTGSRRWLGPQYWANPLEDWQIVNGELLTGAATRRNVQLLTHFIGNTSGSCLMRIRTKLSRVPNGTSETERAKTKAGFAFGIQGRMNEYRNAAVNWFRWYLATIDGNGRLNFSNQTSTGVIPVNTYVILTLQMVPEGSNYRIIFSAQPEGSSNTISLETLIQANFVKGNVGIFVDYPRDHPTVFPNTLTFKDWQWHFSNWSLEGEMVVEDQSRAYGPILWSQYTLSPAPLDGDMVMKMSVQMPPLETADAQGVQLQVRPAGSNAAWENLGIKPIDIYARNAVFRIPGWDATQDYDYRIDYSWQGNAYSWEGAIRKDPVNKQELSVAVMSCDVGYAIPNISVVTHLLAQNPDLLFYAGDQIYEATGTNGIVRDPWKLAILCYLGKWYLWGWSHRELLRNRPAVIIPDDHDMFQGNLFGQGGRTIPGNNPEKYAKGGYTMAPEWVNAVQRTQTAHLPDPVDATPVLQGISVYYTKMTYGRIGFAILEDRKWKTGPRSLYPSLDPDIDADPAGNDFDSPQAELLGTRQEEFLQGWVRDWDGVDMKAVLSQTILSQMSTNSNTDLLPAGRDWDSNAWPQSKRNRALEILRKGYVFMLCGDQHLGALVHLGVHEWEDACVALVVPGVANGFPRAWLPDHPGENGDPANPAYTGRYVDAWGHPVNVIAVANPQPVATWVGRTSEALAQFKGSGYAIARFNKDKRTITAEMYRIQFPNPDQPTAPQNMFVGWPKTVRQLQSYGRPPVALLPRIEIVGAVDPVISVMEEATSALVYALRIRGATFRPPVFSNDFHTLIIEANGQTKRFEHLLGTKAGGEEVTLLVRFDQ